MSDSAELLLWGDVLPFLEEEQAADVIAMNELTKMQVRYTEGDEAVKTFRKRAKLIERIERYKGIRKPS